MLFLFLGSGRAFPAPTAPPQVRPKFAKGEFCVWPPPQAAWSEKAFGRNLYIAKISASLNRDMSMGRVMAMASRMSKSTILPSTVPTTRPALPFWSSSTA